jgi:hypothetical protein
LFGRAVVDSLDADLLALFGDGVLSTDVAPLVLRVGGLSLGVLPIPPPLLIVTLMLESIVGGCEPFVEFSVEWSLTVSTAVVVI